MSYKALILAITPTTTNIYPTWINLIFEGKSHM